MLTSFLGYLTPATLTFDPKKESVTKLLYLILISQYMITLLIWQHPKKCVTDISLAFSYLIGVSSGSTSRHAILMMTKSSKFINVSRSIESSIFSGCKLTVLPPPSSADRPHHWFRGQVRTSIGVADPSSYRHLVAGICN